MPGKIITALELRLGRARKIVAADGVQVNGGPGHFRVHSQAGGRWYDVHTHVDPNTGWLMHARCQCPDWRKMDRALEGWIEGTGLSPHPGIPHIDYSAVCKHCLAALLEMGVIE